MRFSTANWVALSSLVPFVVGQAVCGKSSSNNAKCGMNTCCSSSGYCGTTAEYCSASTCQAGYGSCTVATPPSCSASDNSAYGRAIGYWQAQNVQRRCETVSPSQIKTDNFTHLYYAFVGFDPTTYEIVDDAGDTYAAFTALQSSTLETWVSIGGGAFSQAGAPTFTAWSNMSSTAANRATFISSLQAFADKYNFQGVDLDWEFPGLAATGGGPGDTANYVSLVEEMRAAFGTGGLGISATLPADFGTLLEFDVKGMEASVDWFGFMAYDLASYSANTPKVAGATDLRTIATDARPLWSDGVDPSKLNLGMALYGRGYTLSDASSCSTLGCNASGPGDAGPCTSTTGIMSLMEIQSLILENGLSPTLLQDAQMKQLTYGDQWIGYDDAETYALKKSWASGECFGGTLVWSVDFNNGGGSDYTSPVSSDGSCGPDNDSALCGDFPKGSCCSSAGYCGSTPAYCGTGCQSGPCSS